MASTTTNLGLTKPAYTDDADVAVINANSDIIDSAYGSLSDQIGTVASSKATIKRISKNIPKNGSNTFNYSEFGTLYDGHAFWVTVIGTNNSWRYAGVLFKDSTRTTIPQITASYLTVTADSTKLTVTNNHADYDMNVYVEIIGLYD